MPDAVIRYGDEELTLPTHVGTEEETAVDIGTLRGQLGLVTLDKGFGNTAEGISKRFIHQR